MKKIIRTNHPVGCAAFNTEIFVDYNKRFNVVYDCGYGTGCTKARLIDIVDEVFPPNEHHHIDYLFLSHFDSDHINGLEILESKNLISKETISFLPLIRLEHLKFIEVIIGSYYQLTVQTLIRLRSKIIFIETISQSNNGFPERSQTFPIQGYPNEEFRYYDGHSPMVIDEHVNFDSTFDGYSDAEDVIKQILLETDLNSYPIIKCKKAEQTLIRIPVPNFNWEYIPFYVQPDWVLDKFYEIVQNKFPSFIEKLSQFPFKWDARDRHTLKYLYKNGIGNDYEKACNVTRINMNSMMLLSQPQHDYKEYDTEFSFGRISYRTNVATPSCIYTADVGLKEDMFFNRLDEFAKKNAIKPLDLLQVPHHGSVHCYNPYIFSSPNLLMRNCFVNSNPTSENPRFDTQILIDSSLAGVQCCIVYDNSSLKQTYKLNQGFMFYDNDYYYYRHLRYDLLNLETIDDYLKMLDLDKYSLKQIKDICSTININRIDDFDALFQEITKKISTEKLLFRSLSRLVYEMAIYIIDEFKGPNKMKDDYIFKKLIPCDYVYVHEDIAKAAERLVGDKVLSDFKKKDMPCPIVPATKFCKWLPGFKGYMIELILMVFKEEILNGRFRLSLM